MYLLARTLLNWHCQKSVFIIRWSNELLSRLWVKDAWVVIAFDEIAYIESLSPEVKDLVSMYWREGRSMESRWSP